MQLPPFENPLTEASHPGALRWDRQMYGWFAKFVRAVQIVGESTTNPTSSITASGTISSTGVVFVDASGGAVVVTCSTGLQYIGASVTVKKTDAVANNVTFTPAGSALIDGAATKAWNTAGKAYTFAFDGTNWYTVGAS